MAESSVYFDPLTADINTSSDIVGMLCLLQMVPFMYILLGDSSSEYPNCCGTLTSLALHQLLQGLHQFMGYLFLGRPLLTNLTPLALHEFTNVGFT